jgi:hypothetical protein
VLHRWLCVAHFLCHRVGPLTFEQPAGLLQAVMEPIAGRKERTIRELTREVLRVRRVRVESRSQKLLQSEEGEGAIYSLSRLRKVALPSEY